MSLCLELPVTCTEAALSILDDGLYLNLRSDNASIGVHAVRLTIDHRPIDLAVLRRFVDAFGDTPAYHGPHDDRPVVRCVPQN